MNIDQIAMSFISMDSSQRALQTNEKFFFSNFNLVFEILAENWKILKKRIVRLEHWSKCNVLGIYQWIRLNELYKLMESFFQILESFLELVTIFINNSGIGFMEERWIRHLCSRSSFSSIFAASVI